MRPNFKEMLLTQKALDFLGFSEYWGDCGDSGTRTLDLGGQVGDVRLTSKKEYPLYLIHVIDEKKDGCDGYCPDSEYCEEHIVTKDWETIYFLHDMYEDICKRRTPEEILAFENLLKAKNMGNYLTSYLKYKNENILLEGKT